MRVGVLGLLIGLFIGLATYCGAADAEKAAEDWYVRPIAADEETLGLLDDLGANSVGFRFHLPPNMKLKVTILAKDENGERIADLSSVNELTPRDNEKPFDTSFRLVRIDPGKFTEDYQGKVRWVIHTGPATRHTWQPNRYTATGSYSTWRQGNLVESPKPSKNYLLWKIDAHPKGLRRILPDSPTTFSMQVYFRYEPMADRDVYGSISHGDDEQEYNRIVEDPRKRAPAQQK